MTRISLGIKNIMIPITLSMIAGISSCGDEKDIPAVSSSGSGRPEMSFIFTHPVSTRVSDTGFESGDRISLFVTGSDRPLEIAGNVVTNAIFTKQGDSWTTSGKLYWDEGKYRAYAFYPASSDVNSISDFVFEVEEDQSVSGTPDSPRGYEASDLLYASSDEIKASSRPVEMYFRHILSKLTLRLVKGEEYEGELPEKVTVKIHNTALRATVDLAAGIATVDPKSHVRTITARRNSVSSYSAVIIPQRLETRVPLIELIVGKVSLMYEMKFHFRPGVHHMVNLVLERNPERNSINIGGELTDWDPA